MSKKKTVRITRDIGLTYAPVYKAICDCGWYDKFYKVEIIKKVEAHIRGKHTTGLILNADTQETRSVI